MRHAGMQGAIAEIPSTQSAGFNLTLRWMIGAQRGLNNRWGHSNAARRVSVMDSARP